MRRRGKGPAPEAGPFAEVLGCQLMIARGLPGPAETWQEQDHLADEAPELFGGPP